MNILSAAHDPRVGLAPGLLLLGCTALESGVMGWASVYLDRELHAGESVSSMGLAAFSGAMVIGWLFSDWLVAHYGGALPVRVGAVLCAVAMTLAATLHPMPAAFLAFAATDRLGGETLALAALAAVRLVSAWQARAWSMANPGPAGFRRGAMNVATSRHPRLVGNIGAGWVSGAGSVATRDVPAGRFVAGNPGFCGKSQPDGGSRPPDAADRPQAQHRLPGSGRGGSRNR